MLYHKLQIIFFSSIILIHLNAQEVKFDANWIFGYGWRTSQDDLVNDKDVTQINFNSDPIEIKFIKQKFRSGETSTTLSDSSGNLLFNTNGCYIANSKYEIMENGQEINKGNLYDAFCLERGYPFSQGVLALPLPENKNIYYIFHPTFDYESNIGKDLPYLGFYYSIIDVSANNGAGKVLDKNMLINLKDTVAYVGATACKHANGRDWWIIIPKQSSDEFLIYLFDKNGIGKAKKLKSGIVRSSFSGLTQHKFSPDGRYYAISDRLGTGISLMGFDRCNGEFTSTRNMPKNNTRRFGIAGLAFSENSRFIYVSYDTTIYQYDITSTDIINSRETIVRNDSKFPYHFPTMMDLAPDGRIYISAGSGIAKLNIIYEPNYKGTACNFKYADVLTAPNWVGLNNMPNYRLGAMWDTVCDSLKISKSPVANFRTDTTIIKLERRFTDLSYFNPAKWHWNFGDGDTSKLREPSHVYKDTGKYQVCLTVSNKFGKHSKCREIIVGTVRKIGVGIQAVSWEGGYRVQRNPTEGPVEIQFAEPCQTELMIQVYKMNGKPILAKRIEERMINAFIDLSDHPNGVYILQIRSKTGQTKTTKIVKI